MDRKQIRKAEQYRKGGKEQHRSFIKVRIAVVIADTLKRGGKDTQKCGLVKVQAVRGQVSGKSLQKGYVRVQTARYGEQVVCHWQKNNHADPDAKQKRSTVKEKLAYAALFAAVLHDQTSCQIDTGEQQGHIGHIDAAAHHHSHQQRQGKAEMLSADCPLQQTQQQRQKYHESTELIMLSPDHHITTQSIYIGSDYFGRFRKREAVKEQIAESACQQDLQKDQINQEAGKVSRSKDHSAKIDQHQERIEQVQGEHAGAKAIVGIPHGQASVSKMIYNRSILHQVLLSGIRTGI